MIGGSYKKHHGLNEKHHGLGGKHHGLDEEGVAPSGSGRLVNFISRYKVLSKRKFSVLLDILLCGKKLNIIKVGDGCLVGRRKDILSEGANEIVHAF